MLIEMKIPSPGESITEVSVSRWYKENGSQVEKGEELGEIESEKASLPLIAPENGTLEIILSEGSVTKVGAVACKIDTEKYNPAAAQTIIKQAAVDQTRDGVIDNLKIEVHADQMASSDKGIKVTPLAKSMMREHSLDIEDVLNGLHKISKADIESVLKLSPDVFKDSSADFVGDLEQDISSVQLQNVAQSIPCHFSMFIEALDEQSDLDNSINVLKCMVQMLKRHIDCNYSVINGRIQKSLEVNIAVSTPSSEGIMFPVLRRLETMQPNQLIKDLLLKWNHFKETPISISDLESYSAVLYDFSKSGIRSGFVPLHYGSSISVALYSTFFENISENGQWKEKKYFNVSFAFNKALLDIHQMMGMMDTFKKLIQNL